MINIIERIHDNFSDTINAHQQAATELAAPIANACEMLSQCIMSGNKILCCGNGGSAADAQHFAAEMLNRFAIERPSLPAIALTTDSSTITSIANDYSFTEIFSKQIRALGHTGDVLIAISTSGNSANIIAAINAAHINDMRIILLTGNQGGKMAPLLKADDIMISPTAPAVARIQEIHIFVLHCICDLIDQQLFVGEKV